MHNDDIPNPDDIAAMLGPFSNMIKDANKAEDVELGTASGNFSFEGLVRDRARTLLEKNSLSTSEVALLHALLNYRGNL